MNQQEQQKEQQPVTYGDVFKVSGELAKKAVAPQDAAMMQAAETTVFGGTQKGGTAAAMQRAAGVNERCGFVGPDDVTMDGGHGVTVTATDVPGARVVTETVDGQQLKHTPTGICCHRKLLSSETAVVTIVTESSAAAVLPDTTGDVISVLKGVV